MLGLDGGDIEFIRSHPNRLPTLRRALERGRVFEPAAPRALSGSVWPTFATGRDPGHHGIYQHLVWDERRMGLRRIGPDEAQPNVFWADLEACGHRVVAIDVPYTFAGNLSRGVEITDWATHGQTRPLGLNGVAAASAIDRVGPSPMGRETPVQKTSRQLDRVRRRMIRSARRKGELARDVLRSTDSDLFLMVFGETHRAGHILFGDDPTSLLEVYRAVDDALAGILGTIDETETNVLIFSAHGMTRDYGQGHFVRPILEALNEVLCADTGAGRPPRRSVRIVRDLRRTVPASIQHAVGAASPDFVRQWIVEREIVGGIDWARTLGFALRTDIRAEIRLNLRGRESRGLLPRGSDLHARYVEHVRGAFEALRDCDTGDALVDEVVDVQAEFPGPRRDSLPDLVITWLPRPPATRVRAGDLGTFSARPPGVRGGDHTDHGFAILSGPALDAPVLPALNRTADFAGFARGLLSASPTPDVR